MRFLATIACSVWLVGSGAGQEKISPDAPGKLTPDFRPELVEQLVADAMAHGDARRGAVVFGLSTSACLSCHRVGDQGGAVGPELSKAGVKGGIPYGRTDDLGFAAVENRVHVHDLPATLLHLMGIDHKGLTYRYSVRDFRLTVVHGRVVREILA